MWDTIVAVTSVLIGLAGLLAIWLGWRNSELKKNEVLSWVNEVITVLTSIWVTCQLNNPPMSEREKNERMVKLIYDTSIVVERGRIFFKNEIVDQHGVQKQPAYRGFRPKILDPIVVAHEIASEWCMASEDDKRAMKKIANDMLKEFVSLAQKEVGRAKTASSATKQGGEGARLKDLKTKFFKDEADQLRVQHESLGGYSPEERVAVSRAIRR